MKKNKSILLSTPYLVWMVVFTLIPLGVVCYYALTDPSTGEFSLVNLRGLNLYWGVLWQSIFYAVASAFICLLLGYPTAYYIAHRSQTAQKFLYMLVMLPMCMSFLLRTLAWVGLLQDTGITFKGLNYDIIVEFKGFKWLIQTTDYHAVGSTIGIRLNPEDIHIMHKSEYSGLFGDYSSYSAEYDELTEDAGNEED